MKHSSRLQSMNARRRLRNQRENEFIISEVVKHVLNHSSAIANKMLSAGECGYIDFDYRLDPIIRKKQRKFGAIPYPLRVSKILRIIDQLSDQESGMVAPCADHEIDETGKVTLQMLRA